MGIVIKSDDDLIQFEYELVVNKDLPESVLDKPQAFDESESGANIKEILDLVSKMEKSINPEPSRYQTKKELFKAKAEADIKRDTITNKRK
ncbi:hypothetical protein GCM10008119_35690 [Pedobacter mendelii]|uniref:Uncharacterized protein n=2 Tax=Pedobacter mendelii TaxID=1908240 RepID=A0ABQ2BPD7_9SPHI|nr:hypothetical protein GCM10008119_35690 [Pedobacter mendelii]